MRSTADRIRHAVLFELIAIILVGPLLGWAFAAPIVRVGALSVVLSLVATGWNYIYNIGFDHALQRLRGHVRKRPWERIIHAFLFELGMLVFTIPPVMWWLGFDLFEALRMALSVMVFYLFYAWLYNLVYDHVFPIPEPEEPGWCDSG